MKRALTAAGVYSLVAVLAVTVYLVLVKEPEETAEPIKPGGGYVILTPVEAIEKHRKNEERINTLLKDATAAHQAQEIAYNEAAALREKVAALEAEVAELKKAQAKPRRETVAPGAQAGTFTASHYTAFCTGCSGKTATGLDVSNTIYSPEGYRIVATDPRVIPLGTVLQITYANGTTFKAVAADTGGAIKGRKLDVLVKSKAEAYALGRVGVQVEIVGK